MVKRYTFSIGRKQITFNKYLTLPSSPFCWKKSSIMIMALPALECSIGSVSAFFYHKLLHQLACPFPSSLLIRVLLFHSLGVFPDPSRELFLPSPFPHQDVVWMPLQHFHQGPSSFHALRGQGPSHIHLPEPW